jgi:hypothetical protein
MMKKTAMKTGMDLGGAQPRMFTHDGGGTVFGHQVRVWVVEAGDEQELPGGEVGRGGGDVDQPTVAAPCSNWNLVVAPRVSGSVEGR